MRRVSTVGGVALAASGQLSSGQAARMIREWNALPPVGSWAEVVDHGDRYLLLHSICVLGRHGPQTLRKLCRGPDEPRRWTDRVERAALHARCDFDAALRNANAVYDKLVLVAKAESRTEHHARFREYRQLLAARGIDIDAPRPRSVSPASVDDVGRGVVEILLRIMLPGEERVLDLQYMLRAEVRMLPLALALAGYKADHKAYPAKLAELVPKYVDKLLQDPFSEADFVYRRAGQGYLLYSVGPNEKDDGGHTNEDTPKGDDIAVRVPLPPPKEEPKP